AQLLEGFNPPDAAPAPLPCLHQLFAVHAQATPDAPALLWEAEGARQMSYGELNRRANQLAHRLLAMGVKPDDRVALCVERGPQLVVGMLGILKAGGAHVPLDPAYPAERLAYMLEDSKPVVLL